MVHLPSRPSSPAADRACTSPSGLIFPSHIFPIPIDHIDISYAYHSNDASYHSYAPCRCRVLAHDVTCVGLLVGCKPGGWPTLDALKASSLLPVLPGPVREELQRWGCAFFVSFLCLF